MYGQQSCSQFAIGLRPDTHDEVAPNNYIKKKKLDSVRAFELLEMQFTDFIFENVVHVPFSLLRM